MKFVRFFTDRPVTAGVVYAIFALLGVAALFRMPVDLMPGGDYGVLSIVVGVRGGLPPEDIESLITRVVEDEMATLPNLESIVSVSRKERAVVSLNFKPGTDSSRAALDVQEHLAKIRGKLPKDIEKPVVSRYDENQSPILILAMSSKQLTPEQMREIADNRLKPALKRLNGVANVEIGGGRERKILVEFDQNRLEAYALPIRQVISQIGQENLNILTGKVEGERQAYFVRTVGAFQTLEDIGNLPIAVTKEGSRLLLKDVAEIKDYYLEADSYSRMNREPVVSAYVQKEALANTIHTAHRVKQAAEEFKKTLDPRVNFSIVSDQSIAIEKALQNVWSSLYQGAILAGLILIFLLRDLLSSTFIFIAIPLATVCTLAVMQAFSLSLNVMTISGLAISTGMVVDTSITVLENIIQNRNKMLHKINRKFSGTASNLRASLERTPFSNREVAIESTTDIFLALVASTLTSVIVFLPILFLNPQVRMLYSGLSITCVGSQFISLAVGVTVIPCLWANVPERWMKESAYYSTFLWLWIGARWQAATSRVGRWRSRLRLAWNKRFRKKKNGGDDLIYPTFQARPFRWQPDFRGYRRWVALFMRRRYWTALTLLVLLVATGWMYKTLDKEFVGSTEENEFTIFVELPSGTKLEVSDKVVGEVERLLNETPDIQKSVKSSVSRVEGWSSKIYVTLVPGTERTRTAQEVIAYLRPLLSKIGQQFDAFIYFSEPQSSKEFLIDVFGYDYLKLRDLAVKIAQVLEKVPGLVDLKLRYKPGRPEVRVEVDRERASLLGFTIQDVAETLHAEIRGLRATYFMTPTAQVETVARLQEQYRKSLEDVENLTLINPQGTVVPFRQFSKFAYGLTPSEIWRKNRERMIQVSANREDVALSKVAEQSLRALRRLEVPVGYYFEIGGDFPRLMETEREFRFAFFMMVVLIYTVLASLFESYSQPIIILIAVPLTLIGAVPLLKVTGTPLTLGALIGFILLGGVAVNNSIMLMDVFNTIRKEKKTLRALLQAGQERIQPIVATTLTNVLGMAPLLFQKQDSGSLWKPLAVTVTGGLIVSTILVLFILPSAYLILEDIKKWTLRQGARGAALFRELFRRHRPPITSG